MSKRIIAVLLTLALVLSCVPVMAFAAESTAALTVADVYATPGSTVTVDVEIEGNPGILGATLNVAWADGLTLVDSANGAAFSELTFQAPSRYTSGCNFVWYGTAISGAVDGTILTLTFEVAEDAADADSYAIEVTYDSRDILDENYNSVELSVTNGSIRIVTYKPGDVSGDDRINPLDLIKLCQYISDGCVTDPDGFNITINESAADVNDDGRMNPLDLILISRYISDGCVTDPDGYNITLKPSTPKCSHIMQATAEKVPTCTENGNTAYWYCTECEKYFSNETGTAEIELADTVIAAAHNLTAVEAKSPSYTEAGNIAYWYCSACEKYFADAAASEEITYEDTVIAKLQATEHLVEYDVANGDPYIQKLLDNGTLVNPNPASYAEGTGLTLTNLSVAGYRFLGWYDLAENGTLVREISADATANYMLYAYWSKIEYTVQYKSSLFTDRAQDTYTVDTGLVLPTPKLSNYVFTGWADENGELYSSTMIPVGSTGHMVLEANWTSERNKTWTKTKLDAPIMYTEDNTLFFVYEIGEIQNVPLYTIKDFGYIAEGGVEKSEETTFSTVISEGTAEQIAESVAKATTQSSNWSLSNGWSEGTDISQEWLTEKGYEKEEIIEKATNEESNWNISTGTSGSTDTSTGTSNEKGWTNEAKITGSQSATVSSTISAGLESTVGAEAMGVKAEVSASINSEISGSETASKGFETGGSKSGTAMNTSSTNTSSGWSNSSSYGGSKSSSESHTASTGISEKITEQYGYGKNYTSEYTSGESQGLEYSNDETEEWSSTVTYNTETAESITRSWTTEQTKAGYHRWIMAGTAHVFAVVGYDMETQSYYVYTYTVMDDEIYEFEDYSYTTASYNDHENGVISFEIPYAVAEYVAEQTVYSQGLKVDQETGIITGYTGTENCVVIPEYMNVGDGDVVKIVGLKEGLFANNTNISAVVLSDFITEIPNDCFNGCAALEGIVGGNVEVIGDRAFAGCESIVDCAVRNTVESVGEDAFTNVGRVYFNCANAQVAVAGAASGAKRVNLYLKYLDSAEGMNGLKLETAANTTYFEINGNEQTYTDLVICSNAAETVLNKIHLVGTNGIPVTVSSERLVLNQSSISATGIALVMKAEQTELSLQSTIAITSKNQNAILGKSVTLSESNANVDGYLAVDSKLLYSGTIENTDLITSGTWEKIDAKTYENMLNSYTLYFDANGGSCEESSRVVANSTAVGTLPVPEREHYSFEGWFQSDNTEVTAESVFSTGSDITVYAKWTPVPYTVSWNTGAGYTIAVTRTESPNAGAETGALSSGDTVYYGDVLSITYTASTGYTINSKGSTAVTVSGNVTADDIYATASVNSYTVSWDTGTGYTIAVNRTSSPLKDASTGALNNGATIYYGDVLSVTYTASTGYSLSSQGGTDYTVTRNITKDDIKATASLNSYTYDIVYKSSNDTSLGSTTATYKYGTTNTISAPAKSGYTTPTSQSVKWDSTSTKTITFTYTPASVTNSTKTGTLCSEPVVTYSARLEYQNRTATSVQVRVVWTSTIAAYNYNSYGQIYTATAGSSSTTTTINSYGTWKSSSSSARSSTGTSDWMTVSLNTTNATTVNVAINYYQVNSNGTNMTQHYGAYGYSTTWTANIPAY